MQLLNLDVVDSTNSYALQHFDEVADRVLVSAREQSSGRGRLGRKWLAPPGCNITASFAMSRVADGFHAGVIAGLAAISLVKETLPECAVFLKWPNDIYCGHAKLAGILCEGVVSKGKITGVVAGIGINVNFSADDAANVDQAATSLKILSGGRDFSVANLTKRLAFFIDKWYINYDYSRDSVLAEWKSENRLLGRKIEVIDPAGILIKGIFSDIAEDGSMILETPAGREIFRCGDVKIARNFVL